MLTKLYIQSRDLVNLTFVWKCQRFPFRILSQASTFSPPFELSTLFWHPETNSIKPNQSTIKQLSIITRYYERRRKRRAPKLQIYKAQKKKKKQKKSLINKEVKWRRSSPSRKLAVRGSEKWRTQRSGTSTRSTPTAFGIILWPSPVPDPNYPSIHPSIHPHIPWYDTIYVPSICLPCHLFNSFNEVDKQTEAGIPQRLYLMDTDLAWRMCVYSYN